jgi:glycosyltransferase involved in cell wall biosynthesis
MEIKDCDICITTFNRNERLKLILDSLAKQTNQNFNLIVNDDGSKKILDPNDYPIITKYIWNKDYGYNRVGRFNESILMCVSPKIILLDDDCIPQNTDFVKSHLELLNKADFSKGRVIFPDNNTADSWFSTANIAFNNKVVNDYGLFYPEYNGYYGYEDLDLGKEIIKNKYTVINNTNASVLTGSEMYLNGDRSDAVVGRNRSIYNRRWPV